MVPHAAFLQHTETRLSSLSIMIFLLVFMFTEIEML